MVIPAIIPESKEHLLASLEKLGEVASEIQIDLVDSVYGETPSWPFLAGTSFDEVFETVRGMSKTYEIEVDLMTAEADILADGLIKAGAKRIVFHPQKEGEWPEFSSYRGRSLVGLALHNDMSLEAFFEIAHKIDFVQCMGIAQVGAQGLPFDERVLGHVRTIHEKFPRLPIGVDGGVNMYTVPMLKGAGATRFISGSAIFSAVDPIKAFQELTALANA